MGQRSSDKLNSTSSSSLNKRFYFFNSKENTLYAVHHAQFGGLCNFLASYEESANLDKILLIYQSLFHSDYQLPKPEEDVSIKDLNLSDLDISLRKNLFHVLLSYHKFGEKYNYIFSLYRQILPTNIYRESLDAFILSISPNWHENQLLDYLKNFGTYLLYQITSNDGPLALLPFIEMHMMSGYDTYYHRSFDIVRDTLPFTTSRSLPSLYRTTFEKYIRETIDEIQIYQFPNCNFPDYVRYRDNWNLMGSATLGIPMRVATEGFKKPTRISSKFTNLLYYDDDTLLEKLYQFAPHVARPFLKTDEAAKSRVVIGYDTRSYIRCSYFEKFIKNLNGNIIWTTVGMDPNSLDDVRASIDKNLNTHKFMMVCTDQSAFDQHQYRDMFIYAFDYLCSRIAKLNPQIWPIYQLERYGLNNAKIVFPDGSERKWQNGLLSGHKFTALLGSVLNRASTLTAAHLASLPVDWAIFQGDDALLFTSDPSNIENFLQSYKVLGMEVNPAKTWQGFKRTEYLHQIYIPGACISLPARAALNLIFKDPKANESAPDQYYQAQVDAFRMCHRRGLQISSYAYRYIQDFIIHRYDSAFNISRGYAKLKFKRRLFNYIHTPTLFGGAGFTPYVPRELYTTLEFIKQKDINYQHSSSHIVTPYHYRLPGAPLLTEKWILTKLYQHLPEPHIQTSCRLQIYKFNDRTNLPGRSFPRADFNFNPNYYDNTANWRKHCKSLLNLACVFGMDHINKFQKFRSAISQSYNLNSDIDNAHLDRFGAQCWSSFINRLMAVYVCTNMKLTKVIDLSSTYKYIRNIQLLTDLDRTSNYNYFY